MAESSTLVDVVVGVAMGFGLSLFSPLLQETIGRWVRGPKLKLEFGRHINGCVVPTPARSQTATISAYYVRVKVYNIKPKIAKSCRGYLVNVEKYDPDKGCFVNTEYCDSIQLYWACMGTPERGMEPIDLPKDIPQFCDVLASWPARASESGWVDFFLPEIVVKPYRYDHLWRQSGLFRMTVRVSGDGVPPATIRIVFNWKGKWDDFDAYVG